jgi:hypothetical protein
MLEKHTPDETLPEFEQDDDPRILIKRYDHGITLVFDQLTRVVSTLDPHAIKCVVRLQIEASPVAQSVGSSGLTMPQIGFLGSFESGNAWLNDVMLPGVRKRANTLAYFHAVAGRVDLNAGLEEDEEPEELGEDDFDFDLSDDNELVEA